MEVRAFFKDVVAVKHVAHEVSIIKGQIELLLNFGRDGFDPVGVVAKQRNVQREDFLGCFLMQGLIAYGSSSGGKAVEQRSLLLFGCALKEVALAAQFPFLA